jgi:hypothetical protein
MWKKCWNSFTKEVSVSVPPWPKSVAWYNSEGRIDDETPGSRYRQMADGVGGYMLEVKPTEAADQGEWKCVATSQDGAVSISTCDVNMSSKLPLFLLMSTSKIDVC